VDDEGSSWQQQQQQQQHIVTSTGLIQLISLPTTTTHLAEYV